MCEKLRDRAYNLLRVETEKAREEVLNLALQCARVILLKKGTIPGVKREVVEVVEQIKSENRREGGCRAGQKLEQKASKSYREFDERRKSWGERSC